MPESTNDGKRVTTEVGIVAGRLIAALINLVAALLR